MQQVIGQSTWAQRLFVLIALLNCVVLVGGLFVVPAARSDPTVFGSLLGAMLMQIVLAALALFGPWSLRALHAEVGISFVLGGIFAVMYVGVLALEFLGVRYDVNVYGLFIGVALIAGFLVGLRTRHWGQGVLAAIWALVIGTAIWSTGVLLLNYLTWGSHQQYIFALADGQVDEFRRSGGTNFDAFLLQDYHGALFFHPILSVIVGGIFGAIGSGIAQGIVQLRTRPVDEHL
jgi:hypothetical protein